jgi:hypothetical protein
MLSSSGGHKFPLVAPHIVQGVGGPCTEVPLQRAKSNLDQVELTYINMVNSPGKLMRCGRQSKPYSGCHEAIPKQMGPSLYQVDRGLRVMLRIINALYEEYCQARIDEMLRSMR